MDSLKVRISHRKPTSMLGEKNRVLPKHLEEWLSEHQESVLNRWLDEGAADAQDGHAIDVTGLGHTLLHALTDGSAAEQLFSPTYVSELSLSTWHTFLQAMRLGIVAELRASTPAEESFELLLAADAGFSVLSVRLNHAFEEEIYRIAGERDHYQSLYTVTHEIATSLELDRVVRSALNGAL
ncbi:MAG: hypothetical protein ACYS8X_14965, partial [Planctomycetota bacterium]